jgi:hypothetical protein
MTTRSTPILQGRIMDGEQCERSQPTPDEVAKQILGERDVIKKHFENMVEMKARIARYESKFGIASDQVHHAIDRGELTETDEVCDWILTVAAIERSNAIVAGR